ncbi:PREDICTED: chitinase domain-containing protein 1 [Nelumbo nucifera]|uniref:Chitinase domain-containing protein 1 n=1 Tax=Nelumbo nucifera TaxID=4432 RepID=A0A1U8AFW1_NELNU|nr:PREDICTED: chitinase domain-containing protein 1 [Nelumbo nucifera]
MAKRRVTADRDRRRNRVQPEVQEDQTGGAASQRHPDRRKFVALVFFSILILIISLTLYRIKSNPRSTNELLSVYDRGLVRTNVNYQEILAENLKVSENTSYRHFKYPVLAYVTPWNSKGYELAKRFNSKLTHISPVWYDLKSEGTQLVLEGRHNADLGWISELRVNRHALVLPRFVLEAFPKELLRKKKQWNKAIDLIVTECKEMGYDGIVLESWSRWAAYGVLHDPDMRSKALQFIKKLGQELHSVSSDRNPEYHLQLVYVIGPPHSENLQEHDFGPDDLQNLSNAVDGFSLMTYDFSGPYNPGPNAPLSWIRSTLKLLIGATGTSEKGLAHKIFLGINFYGNDFVLSEGSGGGAITGREYMSLLEKHRPMLRWEDNSDEHLFIYTDNRGIRHAVFYPSLKSISLRLEEAHAWGAGISIWEIGQGLDYFFDLL